MRTAATAEQLLERGVWLAPTRLDGCPILVAVDSCGNERKRVKLLPEIDEERAVRWLEQLLDRVDPPRPRLTLIREYRSRGPEPKPEPDGYRPWEDQLAYALRMARNRARRR